MNDWHEPKLIGNFKNAMGYFIVLTFVSCFTLLLFGGMVCPLFWPYLNRCTDEIAAIYVKDNPNSTIEWAKNFYQWFFGIVLVIWFVASWAFFIFVIAPQIR